MGSNAPAKINILKIMDYLQLAFDGNIQMLKFVNQWYFLVNPIMHEIANTEDLHSRKLISDMHLFNVMVDLMAQNQLATCME